MTQITNIPMSVHECQTCSNEIHHICECGEELTATKCEENGGMCNDCLFRFHL